MPEKRRKLPKREYVFILSLMYHGFRMTYKRHNLKVSRGYVIPASSREDASGVDFWVKMPRDMRLIPVQITQRGIRMYKKHHRPSPEMLALFMEKSNARIGAKQKLCKHLKIAFVLVRDFEGAYGNANLAWGDIKALRYALERLPKTVVKV